MVCVYTMLIYRCFTGKVKWHLYYLYSHEKKDIETTVRFVPYANLFIQHKCVNDLHMYTCTLQDSLMYVFMMCPEFILYVFKLFLSQYNSILIFNAFRIKLKMELYCLLNNMQLS